MSKNKESGFSLVELLVAIALLLVILGPLLSFMKSAQELRSTSYRLTDVEQNARAALLLIGRDLQNAGYNFPPKITLPTGASNLVSPLLGTGTNAINNLYPIIPGNDVNKVDTTNSDTGAVVQNLTDQITLVYTNQIFNNGLPLVGRVNTAGTTFTLLPSMAPAPPNIFSSQSLLYTGDYCVLNAGQNNAIGIVGSNTSLGGTVINFSGGAGLNTLDPQGLNQVVTVYNFYFVTYFVDSKGNLIRREHLSPPHTAIAPVNHTTFTTRALSPITSPNDKYTCAATNTCYYDNIIATGVEDLQISYLLTERKLTANGAFLTTGPVSDPGFYGSATNQGTKDTEYRLLDIRRVNISIKVRAQERDVKIKDPYNKKMGYLYRFSLDGSYNTRNFYGANYKPITP